MVSLFLSSAFFQKYSYLKSSTYSDHPIYIYIPPWIVALACFPLDPTSSEASSPSLGQGPHAIDPLLKGISTRPRSRHKANTTAKDERGSVFHLPVKRLARIPGRSKKYFDARVTRYRYRERGGPVIGDFSWISGTGGRGKVRNLAPRSRLRDGMRPSIRVPVTAKRNESGRVRSSSSLFPPPPPSSR